MRIAVLVAWAVIVAACAGDAGQSRGRRPDAANDAAAAPASNAPSDRVVARLAWSIFDAALHPAERTTFPVEEPFLVDVGSFRARLSRFAGRPVSREVIASAFGRPFGEAAVPGPWPHELLPNASRAVHIRLDTLETAGDRATAAVTLSYVFPGPNDAMDYEIEAYEFVFTRVGEGWRLASRRMTAIS